MGLRTVADLLALQPAGLHVWPATSTIAEAAGRRGKRVTVEGRVVRSVLRRIGGKRSMVRATLVDGTGELDLVFFNQPWMKEQLSEGRELVAHGEVTGDRGASIPNPRLGSEDRPLPPPGTLETLYPAGDGVSADALAGWIQEALERFADEVEEPLPADFLERVGAPDLPHATRRVHLPESAADFEDARRRFALEPILRLQARVQARRSARGGNAAPARVGDAEFAELCACFPFDLTPAQARVAAELRADLARSRPMRRLLQGDVGAGKTAVAAIAAMVAAASGGQVAMMAPTETLAAQHSYGLRPLLERAGLRAELLTGSLRPAERRAITEALARGEVDVLFGTHALFSDDVAFRRLTLCVVDEQHRFGVAQRGKLAAKGAREPHVLLMTATPIPRSLALSIYGDLDVSVLDGAPPGRGAITTRWARAADRRRMPRFLLERIAAGEQVFWVVPRIGGDGAEASSGASAEARHADLVGRPAFRAAGVELVHGRMPAEERAMRLDRFRAGEVATLVATTVVEVGVDVPGATVMVVEDAHRLGLAQLHQLRGRVGRGGGDAWCFLLGDRKAEERFRLLERSRDGFELSEEDLRQRGMGDLLGLRQSGVNTEGLIDPERDLDLLLAARDLFATRPELVARYADADANGAPGI